MSYDDATRHEKEYTRQTDASNCHEIDDALVLRACWGSLIRGAAWHPVGRPL